MDSMTDLGREALWTHARLLMLTATFDGTIVAANPAWMTILGWPVERVIGKNFFDFVHPDDLKRTAAEAALMQSKGKQVPKFQNRYRANDGSYRDIDWTAVADGQFIHALGRDNTDELSRVKALADAEDNMRQSQKMEAIGQFTGGVAHDFNNLLTVIKGSIDLLQRPNLSEERRKKYIQAIGDTADRAARLTGQLLAFARRQALKPEVFEVSAAVTALAEMIPTLTGSRVELVVLPANEPLFVLADRSQLETAVINMAINARDAMKGEGRLTIAAGSTSAIPARRIHPSLAGDYVTISVKDTGCGISAGDMSRIFEPFFTTKQIGLGTGLGLSQVIGFAKQSGGDVDVESQIGQGATFTLYLPRTSSVTARESDAVSEARIDGAGICVLVVEDNPSVGDFTAAALHELGYESVLATNAEDALDELARDCDRFHVVFSDVVMPGMSGIELGQRIQRDYPNIPVVLATGYSSEVAKSGDHGFALLTKPYSVRDLSRALHKARALLSFAHEKHLGM
jgi:PAS domain S-box-containing protein